MSSEYTLQEIADRIGGELCGDGDVRISGIAPFEDADAGQITFAGGSKFLKRIDRCRAGAIIVPDTFSMPAKNLIRVANPQLAFTHVVTMYHPESQPEPGIHAMAALGDDVQYDSTVSVAPFVQIGNRATIGEHTVIHSGTCIGEDVSIGNQTVIHPNVTIMSGCRIGNRVTIHAGSVIGSDGYGFVFDSGRNYKIPQIGIVQIDDDAEIGACNTIDRATFGRTWIQRGVKTDNLVHIAHNVVIGEDSLILGQVGIAGSTTIGHHAVLAGKAGVSDHLTIGNHATIGPKTGVYKSVSDGQVVASSTTAMPYQTWLRSQRMIPILPDLKKKIADLEKKIAILERDAEKG